MKKKIYNIKKFKSYVQTKHQFRVIISYYDFKYMVKRALSLSCLFHFSNVAQTWIILSKLYVKKIKILKGFYI